MRILSLIFVALFTFTANAETHHWAKRCESFASPLSGGYCVHINTTNPSSDIVYHLHGLKLDENAFSEQWYYTGQLRSEWKKHNRKTPTVVSISFGQKWLLAEKNSSEYSGLFETLTTQIIPAIEKKLGGLKGRRMIFGESMGGFNSVQLSLKTDLFHKAGIICSPMAPVSPFDSDEIIRRYVESTSAWQFHEPQTIMKTVLLMKELTTTFYPTPELWNNADPLQLANNPTSLKTKMYVAIGYKDRFAAYEANEIFVNTLKSKGMNVEWRPQWGGHCAIDIPSLASFLID